MTKATDSLDQILELIVIEKIINGDKVRLKISGKTETKAALLKWRDEEVVVELKKLIRPSAVHGYLMNCGGNEIAGRIKQLEGAE